MAQNKIRLKEFLEADASDYDPDSPKRLMPYDLIVTWARDPEHGRLPDQSALPFADWLDQEWSGWTEEPRRVRDVLEGAVTAWCGGRTF